VIQTCTPKNEVIRFAAQQDYDRFYEAEILLREMRRKPPYCECYRITLMGNDNAHTWQVAQRICAGGKQWLNQPALQAAELRILGPAEATVLKVNNRYRYHIYLFSKGCPQVREMITHLLLAANEDKQNRGVSIYADWNPLDS
jgi:primosomal protein N' (replication factor Y)